MNILWQADTGKINSIEDPETSISKVAAKHHDSSNGKRDVVIEMETITAGKSSGNCIYMHGYVNTQINVFIVHRQAKKRLVN